MKRIVVAVVLSLFVALIAGSVSAGDVSGTIKVIETKERVMTLSDGTQLYWTESYTVAPEFKADTKVKATYESKDGKMELQKLEVVK